mmetsp:Transcript_11516/g.28366  ORF Transcript_11516/g.28366 Transcript_11516/m.28366 type:complete len:382 (-) Transcript_11516:284-1429(-)
MSIEAVVVIVFVAALVILFLVALHDLLHHAEVDPSAGWLVYQPGAVVPDLRHPHARVFPGQNREAIPVFVLNPDVAHGLVDPLCLLVVADADIAQEEENGRRGVWVGSDGLGPGPHLRLESLRCVRTRALSIFQRPVDHSLRPVVDERQEPTAVGGLPATVHLLSRLAVNVDVFDGDERVGGRFECIAVAGRLLCLHLLVLRRLLFRTLCWCRCRSQLRRSRFGVKLDPDDAPRRDALFDETACALPFPSRHSVHLENAPARSDSPLVLRAALRHRDHVAAAQAHREPFGDESDFLHCTGTGLRRCLRIRLRAGGSILLLLLLALRLGGEVLPCHGLWRRGRNVERLDRHSDPESLERREIAALEQAGELALIPGRFDVCG